MPTQIHLTALIDLPTDIFEAARIIESVAAPWTVLLEKLKDVPHTHSSKTVEPTAARANHAGNGVKKRVRRTKAQMAADANVSV